MRKGNDCDFIYNDNQEVIGLCLGADFCSEHEWGIDKIKGEFGMPVNESERPFASWWKSILGINKPPMGIEKRAITKCPETVLKGEGEIEWKDYQKPKSKKESKKVYYIGYQPYYYSKDHHSLFQDNIKRIFDGSKSVWGWWAEGDFMVASTNKEIIDQLFQAFQDKDIVIMLSGSGNPFQNSGLCIIQKSKISEENAKSLYDGDFNAFAIKQAAVKTGIYDRLEKADKKFFALSPRWKDETKKEVTFWLNPEGQDIYNFGWYSVEDLDLWAKNEGPVMMSEEKLSKKR